MLGVFPPIFNSTWMLLTIPGLLLSIIAQLWLKSAFNKYSQVEAITGKTASQIIETVKRGENMDITHTTTPGELTDHYDPVSNIVNVSDSNSGQATITAIAITCHELGHAMQDHHSMGLMNLRNFLASWIGISTNIGYLLIMAGFGLQFVGLAYVGLIFFFASALFSLITLPIEIDASVKALGLIRKYNFLSESEIPAARQVLTAAALTYIAALVSSLGQWLYFFLQVRNTDSNND